MFSKTVMSKNMQLTKSLENTYSSNELVILWQTQIAVHHI